MSTSTESYSDIRENPEFSLESQWYSMQGRTGMFNWVVKFRPNFLLPKNPQSMLRIIDRIFVMENGVSIKERMDTLHNSDNAATISAFYSMLHDAHETTNTLESGVILPKCLKPDLRPYQLRALDWMINRERQLQYYPNEFVSVRAKDGSLSDQTFYFNVTTYQLLDELPGPVKAPSGGILGTFQRTVLIEQFMIFCLSADEMGLGKTIEILALVLCNKQNKRKREDEEEEATPTGTYYNQQFLRSFFTTQRLILFRHKPLSRNSSH